MSDKINQEDIKKISEFLESFRYILGNGFLDSFDFAINELSKEPKNRGFVLPTAIIFREIFDNFKKLISKDCQDDAISLMINDEYKQDFDKDDKIKKRLQSINQLIAEEFPKSDKHIKQFLLKYVYFNIDIKFTDTDKSNYVKIFKEKQKALNDFIHDYNNWSKEVEFLDLADNILLYLKNIAQKYNEIYKESTIDLMKKIDDFISKKSTTEVIRIIHNNTKFQQYFLQQLAEKDQEGNWFDDLKKYICDNIPHEAIKDGKGITEPFFIPIIYLEKILEHKSTEILEIIDGSIKKMTETELPNVRLLIQFLDLVNKCKNTNYIDKINNIIGNFSLIVKNWQSYSQWINIDTIVNLLAFLSDNKKLKSGLLQSLLTLTKEENNNDIYSKFFQLYTYQDLLRKLEKLENNQLIFEALCYSLIDCINNTGDVDSFNKQLGYVTRPAIENHSQNHHFYLLDDIIDCIRDCGDSLIKENEGDFVFNLLLKDYLTDEKCKKIVLFERVAMHLALKNQKKKEINSFLVNKDYFEKRVLYWYEYWHLMQSGIGYLDEEDKNSIINNLIPSLYDEIEISKSYIDRNNENYNEKDYTAYQVWKRLYPIQNYLIYNLDASKNLEKSKEFCLSKGYDLQARIDKNREHPDFLSWHGEVMVGEKSLYSGDDIKNILSSSNGVNGLIIKMINHQNEITRDDEFHDGVNEYGFAEECAKILISNDYIEQFFNNIDQFINNGEKIKGMYFSSILSEINKVIKLEESKNLLENNINKLYSFIKYIILERKNSQNQQGGIQSTIGNIRESYQDLYCIQNATRLLMDLFSSKREDILSDNELKNLHLDILIKIFNEAKQDDIKRCFDAILKLFNKDETNEKAKDMIIRTFEEIKNNQKLKPLLYYYGQYFPYWKYTLKWQWAIDNEEKIFNLSNIDWFSIAWIGCIEHSEPFGIIETKDKKINIFEDLRQYYIFSLTQNMNSDYSNFYNRDIAWHFAQYYLWDFLNDELLNLIFKNYNISVEFFNLLGNWYKNKSLSEKSLKTAWDKKMNFVGNYETQDLQSLEWLLNFTETKSPWVIEYFIKIYSYFKDNLENDMISDTKRVYLTEDFYAKMEQACNEDNSLKRVIKELLNLKFKNNDNYFDWISIKDRNILTLINKDNIENAPLEIIEKWNQLDH